jgi:hypothetical protein
MAICLTAGVFAQGIPIEVMPILKTGAIFTAGGATEFGFGAGANIDIYRDSASGFATYTYLGKFFSGRGENNIEFSTSFLYVEKYFPNFKGDFKPYIAIGAGYVHDGKAAYSLDLGGVIYHQVGLSLGSWYAPESDEVFVSLNINLTP